MLIEKAGQRNNLTLEKAIRREVADHNDELCVSESAPESGIDRVRQGAPLS